MNRPQNHAESAFFIHQRYEDTALVIFQQQIKKKGVKKNLSQLQPLPYQVQAPPQPQLSPGKGSGASRSSPGLESPGHNTPGHTTTSGSSSPQAPASPSRHRTKLLSAANASSAPSAHTANDGLPAGAAAGPVSEGVLAAALETEAVAPVIKQSDIILSHPLSNLEPEVTCGSAVDSPLQSSTHSDLTNPTSDNTASVNSNADDSFFHSDTESDTAVKPDDPETDDETTRVSHVSECEVKADFADPTEDKVKLEDDRKHSSEEQVNASPEDDIKHCVAKEKVTVAEEKVTPSPVDDGKHGVSEEKARHGSAEEEVHHALPTPEVEASHPGAAEEEVKQPISDGVGTDPDSTEHKPTSPSGEVKKDLPDVHAEDEFKHYKSSADSKRAERPSVSSSRVSGVEFAHYGSAGVVARRRVEMSKSDQSRTQSRVCVVM